jgi:hypothetical protein
MGLIIFKDGDNYSAVLPNGTCLSISERDFSYKVITEPQGVQLTPYPKDGWREEPPIPVKRMFALAECIALGQDAL